MITTQLIREQDIPAAYEIETEAFSDPWTLRSLQRELCSNEMARYMGVYEDDRLVGYAGAWLVLNEAQITKVAVKKEVRGRGIGETVMRALIQLSADSGMTWMSLEVRAGNTAARALYRKLGFTEVGLRKRYYENTEDAVLMQLDELPEGHPENDPFLVIEEEEE